MRSARIPAVAAAFALAAAALAAGTAAGAAAASPCSAGQLAAGVRQTQGAAGTLAASIALRNVSAQACTLRGFPLLKLRGASGQLATRVRHGGIAFLERPVKTIRLDPRRRATLLVAWSDVPTGSETTCEPATTLVIILGDGRGRLRIPFAASPCNRGLLRSSPFLPGLVDA